jgi:hypothetical protein
MIDFISSFSLLVSILPMQLVAGDLFADVELPVLELISVYG